MKVVLELKEPLTDKEIERLPVLLRDAFGEFQTHRKVRNRGTVQDRLDAEFYVRKRYDESIRADSVVRWSDRMIEEKVDQVIERCREAQKLHDAEVVVEGGFKHGAE